MEEFYKNIKYYTTMTTQTTYLNKLTEIKNNLMFAKFELEHVKTANKTYKSIAVKEIFEKIDEIYETLENVKEVNIQFFEMLIADLYNLLQLVNAKIVTNSKEAYFPLMHMICANISKVCKLRRIMYVELEEQKYM